MFINKVLKENKKLIDFAKYGHKLGMIQPDTYVIDIDMLLNNAQEILKEANKYNIKLYYMLKQIGRNPYIAKLLDEMGYEGCVAVDFKEAQIMMENNIKLGNIGHLVQIPKNDLRELMEYGVEEITCFTVDKVYEVDKIAKELKIKQKILLKIIDVENDVIYEGQYGGFEISTLKEQLRKINKLSNITIEGVTSFPVMLYDSEKNETNLTNNFKTISFAKNIMKEMGIEVGQFNTPSSTSVETIKRLSECGSTHAEPGHSLTGTTPYHKNNECKEKIAYIYVSEISHNLNGKSFCYGGGHYRRSHMEKCIIDKEIFDVKELNNESIDYYFEIDKTHKRGETVLMCFRTQMFVIRSNIALVEGIQSNNPNIIGIYTSGGRKIEKSNIINN